MLTSAIALLAPVSAWYLPGIAPTDYDEGERVPVLVNRLTVDPSIGGSSAAGGLDYFNPHLKFCTPQEGKQARGGSLGSILFGDRIYDSPIEIEMLKNKECQHLCSPVYKSTDAEFLTNKIIRGYMQHWIIDGLPAAGLSFLDNTPVSDTGFFIGELYNDEISDHDEVIVYNHFDITVDYHFNEQAKKYRVVGAQVHPQSIGSFKEDEYKCTRKNPDDFLIMKTDSVMDTPVKYTYSVKWQQSETPWATRWDQYLKVSAPVINWFALINTTFLVFALCFICVLVLTRMLRKDIAQYNQVDLSTDDIPDEAGWKMVAGDVFRPVSHPQVFAIATGTGAQVLATFLVTVTLAALGLLSPANRGSFSTALLLLNTVLGGVGGYVSAVTYKTWGGSLWKTNLVFTPLVLPALIFALFFITNLLLVIHNASGAVPIGSIIVVIIIWGAISVPLSWGCGFLGFKRAIPFPPTVRVNQIPRQIPPQPYYLKTPLLLLITGLIPYLAVSLQLKYILSAIWFQHIYYMFGFLFASVWAMVVLSAVSSLLALYYTLVSEDYRWQWRSFAVAGSPAFYVFIYSLWYMFSTLSMKSFTGVILYLTYTSLISVLVFLALGSVGSICCYILVCKIYQSIKME